MAITDKKVSETYAGRDISSLSDRPNEDGLTGAQLKARFDQLGKEVIPNYNDLIDELNDVVLPAKADQATTYTKTESDSLLGAKVDKVSGKSLVSDSAITDLTDSGDTILHKHDTMYYTESETDTLLLGKSDTTHTHDDRYYTETETDNLLDDKVDKVVGSSLVSDSIMTDLTDLGDSSAHYHSTDRNADNHTDGTTNKVFSATEKTKLSGIETGAEVNNISDINATDLTDGLNTTLHIHTADRDTDNHTDGVTNKVFTAIEKSKLNGIEALAEVNNISDVNATDLTDGGNTTLHIHDIYVDKVAGKELISSTTLTDLTDSGDTTLHTHKSIVNEVSVDNAKVEALSTGVSITSNVANANQALIVDKKLGTSDIALFKYGGATKFTFSQSGNLTASNLYASSLINTSAAANAKIDVATAGTKIIRDVADANSALIVNQANASSTGKILDLQFGGVSKASVDKDGVIKIGTKTPASATATGVAGTVCWDADYIYVCTATNTWKRVAIATW